MNWIKTMRLSVMVLLASGLIAGCSSDPNVDEPADAGQEDVQPDEDGGDAGEQDACLALPECEQGFEEVDSCDEVEGACGATTLCGTTILCAEEGSCTEVPVCEADQSEVESCEGIDGCIERSACGETYGCAPHVDTCDAEPVCGEDEVEVDACDGVEGCREVTMCGDTILCAPEATDACDPAAYTCPQGLELVSGAECTVDLGPDADRMCFTVEICPDVNVFCRGAVVNCTGNYDACPPGYSARTDCNGATRECGITLVCEAIGGCEANAL